MRSTRSTPDTECVVLSVYRWLAMCRAMHGARKYLSLGSSMTCTYIHCNMLAPDITLRVHHDSLTQCLKCVFAQKNKNMYVQKCQASCSDLLRVSAIVMAAAIYTHLKES